MHCAKNFAKTLDLKREYDVTNSAHPATMTTIRRCWDTRGGKEFSERGPKF